MQFSGSTRLDELDIADDDLFEVDRGSSRGTCGAVADGSPAGSYCTIRFPSYAVCQSTRSGLAAMEGVVEVRSGSSGASVVHGKGRVCLPPVPLVVRRAQDERRCTAKVRHACRAVVDCSSLEVVKGVEER